MIFVTVGTHEQSFDRLVKKIDELKGSGVIKDEVIVQKGYTNYEPNNCISYKLINYQEVNKYMKEARIIITHGGPASFIAPLALKKIPIVVPRMKQFSEHVNDHQLDFVKQIEERDSSIIPCYDIEELETLILSYDDNIKNTKLGFKSNNKEFCKKLNLKMEKMFN